jgi:hypothetical protein
MTERQLKTRIEMRITSLVNRGRDICAAYEPREPLHSVPGCNRCGYTSDVHLLRDILAILDAPRTTPPAQEPWQPIETAPKDGTTILRPHRIWGAMDVRYLTEDQRHFTSVLADGIPWEWVNGDYTTAWTDSAFLPYWMPLPEPPKEPR